MLAEPDFRIETSCEQEICEAGRRLRASREPRSFALDTADRRGAVRGHRRAPRGAFRVSGIFSTWLLGLLSTASALGEMSKMAGAGTESGGAEQALCTRLCAKLVETSSFVPTT